MSNLAKIKDYPDIDYFYYSITEVQNTLKELISLNILSDSYYDTQYTEIKNFILLEPSSK
jgi:hypothetical protein